MAVELQQNVTNVYNYFLLFKRMRQLEMKLIRLMMVSSDARLREHLSHVLSKNDKYQFEIFKTGKDAIEQVNIHPFQVVYSDWMLADMSGIELVNKVQDNFPSIYSLIGSHQGSIQDVISAMQSGVKDFILDPFEPELVACALDKASKEVENELYTPDSSFITKPSFITGNKKLLDLLGVAKKIAHSNASILITGESGTGKERLASFIHENSDRKNEPYIAINCAALPDQLAESELFGHEKGSFTGAISRKVGKFEGADKGTLVLDEITEMALSLQAKLLRVLQEREVVRLGSNQPIPIDVRVIAISNRKIKKAINEGAFREDLFYRLNVIPLTIPPLRERKDDVLVLAEYFLKRFNNEYGMPMRRISDAAMESLLKQTWPGNVRELENAIKRGILLCDGEELSPDHLLLEESINEFSGESFTTAGKTVREMEKDLITNTLQFVNDNRTHAAKMLGISIRTLRNKLNDYKEEKKTAV